MTVILGIDPGSRVAGFGCVELRPGSFPKCIKVVTAGVIKADLKLSMPERLGQVHESVYDLIGQFEPKIIAIEKAFAYENISTAIKLGEARGAIMAAAYRGGGGGVEATPAEVKQLIAGNGRASKEQVSMALKALLNFDRGKMPHDASDALALAMFASWHKISGEVAKSR